MTAAQQLAESLYPWSHEGALRVVRAYLAEPLHGDASPELVRELLEGSTMSDDELDAFAGEVQTLRAAHFAELGQTAPAWRGLPLL